jgi:DNA helicase HerA-like ATPase
MNQIVSKRQIRLGHRVVGPGDSAVFKLQKHAPINENLVTMPVESLARHACIFGRTGSGKSVTGMVIASELNSLGGVSVLVLDRTGEFAHSPLASLPGATVYTPGLNFTIPPFARRSDNREDDLERSISLMHHFVGSTFKGVVFSPYQERALRNALKTCYGYDSSRLSDVLSELEAQGERASKEVKGWLEGNQAVISRLLPLASGSLAPVFDVDGPGLSGAELFEPGLRIVDLGVLDTDEARNMVSQILCKRLISHGKKLGQSRSLRFVLMVDEAQHIAPSRWDYDGILEKYAEEMRKYGMGLIVIATRPTQVSENIIANSNTIISHGMTSGKDIDLALNYMVSKLETERFLMGLRNLEVGECLVQTNDVSSVNPGDLPGRPAGTRVSSRSSYECRFSGTACGC